MRNKLFKTKMLSVILAAAVTFSSVPVGATNITGQNEDDTAANINVQAEVNQDESDTSEDEVTEDSNSSDTSTGASTDTSTDSSETGKDDDSVPEDSDLTADHTETDDTVSGNDVEKPEKPVFEPGGAWEIARNAVKEDYNEQDVENLLMDLENNGVNVVREKSMNGDALYTNESSYDPRLLGKVTSIKDQGRTSLCWDYSAMSTIESNLVYSGLADTSVDLSELHAAYFLWDQAFKYYGYTFSEYVDRGGASYNVIVLANAFYGPVKEEVAPMVPITDDTKLDASLLKRCDYELESFYEVNLSPQNRSYAKELIKQTGGLMASYWSDDYSYQDDVGDADDAAFYNPYWDPSQKTNHAIEIVGWDDNFSRDNFSDYNIKPDIDGAWLIKNSWGTRNFYSNYSASGYYWISYQEGSLNSHESYAVQFAPVGSQVRGISIANSLVAVHPNETCPLYVDVIPNTAAKKVGFESENNKATVDANGNVTGQDYGKGQIKVYSTRDDKVCSIAAVNVYMSSISLKPDPYYGATFKKGQMKTPLMPCFENGKTAYSYGILNSSFQWSSSNPKVASVTANGTVVAKKDGVANIKVTFKNSVYTNGVLLTASYPVVVGTPSKCTVNGAGYSKNGDGTYTYTKAPSKEKVTVPTTIKLAGKKVKVSKISKNAFKNNKTIKSVVIPNTITSIGDKAFYGCKNLKKVTIKSAKITSIGKGAFSKISKKAIIYVPKKCKKDYTNMLKGKITKGVKIK